MSNREADAAIISIAQHARPNPIGQMDDSRAQFSTRSMLVVMKLSSNRWSMRPMCQLGSVAGAAKLRLCCVIIPVPADERVPLLRRFVQRENGLDRTGRNAGTAVDALVRVNIKHFSRFVRSFVFARMNTVDRAHLHAGGVLCPDAR